MALLALLTTKHAVLPEQPTHPAQLEPQPSVEEGEVRDAFFAEKSTLTIYP